MELLSGLTAIRAPYRLAISTMQAMTEINCIQRVAFTDAFVPIPTLLATLMFRPEIYRSTTRRSGEF